MTEFVLVRMHTHADRLAEALTLIRREFGRPQAQQRGRQRGRLFQRLSDSRDLLGLIEWQTRAAHDAYRSTDTHRAILDTLEAPVHSRYVVRRMTYERMYQRAAVAACGLITCGESGEDLIDAFLRGPGRAEMMACSGLVSHEIYRTHARPYTYAVVHQWRELADLEQFRAGASPDHQETLRQLGATIERYTGRLTVETPPE